MTAPRRWSFGLGTMLLGVTLVCVPLGAWVGYSLNWIRERHKVTRFDVGAIEYVRAPMGLWIFGEQGRREVTAVIQIQNRQEGAQKREYAEAERRRIQQLFPEAEVDVAFALVGPDDDAKTTESEIAMGDDDTNQPFSLGPPRQQNPSTVAKNPWATSPSTPAMPETGFSDLQKVKNPWAASERPAQ